MPFSCELDVLFVCLSKCCCPMTDAKYVSRFSIMCAFSETGLPFQLERTRVLRVSSTMTFHVALASLNAAANP